MNSRTSKQLARAASALALVHVSNDPAAQKLTPTNRVQVTHLTARTTYKRLKARWKATPRLQRAAMRRHLVALTQRTSSALAKGQA